MARTSINSPKMTATGQRPEDKANEQRHGPTSGNRFASARSRFGRRSSTLAILWFQHRCSPASGHTCRTAGPYAQVAVGHQQLRHPGPPGFEALQHPAARSHFVGNSVKSPAFSI